jgi:hypothetical protein
VIDVPGRDPPWFDSGFLAAGRGFRRESIAFA